MYSLHCNAHCENEIPQQQRHVYAGWIPVTVAKELMRVTSACAGMAVCSGKQCARLPLSCFSSVQRHARGQAPASRAAQVRASFHVQLQPGHCSVKRCCSVYRRIALRAVTVALGSTTLCNSTELCNT